ncbi:acetate regulatory DNA binding protein FacB [Histoplasma capsulatum]|uniref:Acetate regulatory DNA binding protein FacB n=1 Tax=Ajellomyces capsulatus TaxID=5037 RepID=A0A8A1MCZ0_AJECA|nr:hypothetical protein HCAG_05007 [Histoplasma mississippiense (nom. inval.)]EDN08508.1 hypothetical protein HCAG_05007 [Histoplasma mississippiense (nom. inval.)]QSS63070.1 acetate regulatory DNA binding protein FacB [Histoplasma capsulatum]
MPGILPMKVIKVGNSSQSRVAQACDRCRSKKIRCDGIRPCCSQCAHVGFECKTSDKLSRRAFPRGYTESLEDRVRSLEAEVRELKGLLDEKDEKIDVLSRLQSFSSSRKTPPHGSTEPGSSPSDDASPEKREDMIHVQHSCSLLRKPTTDAPFTGPSSTRAFIDAFANKLERSGKSAAGISAEQLLGPPSLPIWAHQDVPPRSPPRLVSDQLINIFFQEWAPLYPVIHRPTLLKIYGQYTNNPAAFEGDPYYLAQLNLIFGISAISSTARIPQDPALFEQNWVTKLDALADDISLPALQCYILGQIYYTIKADYKSLLRYRGIAVGMCHQLGLHQSQRRFSFSPLTSEMRKKVFWCQYVLDRFAAAMTGLPVLLAESDVCAEFPVDIDDENITEGGFVPTLPGEPTRVSSALALFSAARILSKVLAQLYPSPAGYNVSLSTVHSLGEELDEWQRSLPQHLQLEFTQDKPSTNVTGSRSPLLSIMYYFIRSLIRRPAVCFAPQNTASPSILALVDSGKHIIQILQLLEERRMSLALSINKRELLFASSLGVLWQNVDLGRDCKLVKEGQKLLSSALSLLECESPEAATEFHNILNIVSPVDDANRVKPEHQPHSNSDMSAPSPKVKSPRKTLSLESRHSFNMNTPQSSDTSAPSSSPDLCERSIRSSSSLSMSSSANAELTAITPRSTGELSSDYLNLDYLPLGNQKVELKATPGNAPGGGFSISDWEQVLGGIDNGHANIFNGIYGGGECGDVNAAVFAQLTPTFHFPSNQPQPPQQSLQGWSPEEWPSSASSDFNARSGQSAISYSEDNIGPLDELPPPALRTKQCDSLPQTTQVQQSPLPRHPAPTDGLDNIIMSHNLGALDNTPDFGGIIDAWDLRQPA